jgi:hypothetical protein
LPATGPEHQGWRVNVQTPGGIEACGVLIAPSDGLWRARILTFPNVLWTVPGGEATLKFVGSSAAAAERQAIAFIREHVRNRGYAMRDEVVAGGISDFELSRIVDGMVRPDGPPATRRIRFLPVRYGLTQITEKGGTGNLSETGLFIITNSPEDQGTWLNMMIELDGDSVGLRGLVRWMNRRHRAGRSPGMGIQLEEPPPSYLDYLRTL